MLARVLEHIGKGDTLVVVRIDRLARSLSHLLEVIEILEAKGAFFHSIKDPIDTGSPQGKFTLLLLGAAAEFERALKTDVRDEFLPAEVLDRTGRRKAYDRLPSIVAAIIGADPGITLQAICDRLEAMREGTPRGRSSWQPSSVRMMLERAERPGLLGWAWCKACS